LKGGLRVDAERERPSRAVLGNRGPLIPIVRFAIESSRQLETVLSYRILLGA
jgi:hypothetical protein